MTVPSASLDSDTVLLEAGILCAELEPETRLPQSSEYPPPLLVGPSAGTMESVLPTLLEYRSPGVGTWSRSSLCSRLDPLLGPGPRSRLGPAASGLARLGPATEDSHALLEPPAPLLQRWELVEYAVLLFGLGSVSASPPRLSARPASPSSSGAMKDLPASLGCASSGGSRAALGESGRASASINSRDRLGSGAAGESGKLMERLAGVHLVPRVYISPEILKNFSYPR